MYYLKVKDAKPVRNASDACPVRLYMHTLCPKLYVKPAEEVGESRQRNFKKLT